MEFCRAASPKSRCSETYDHNSEHSRPPATRSSLALPLAIFLENTTYHAALSPRPYTCALYSALAISVWSTAIFLCPAHYMAVLYSKSRDFHWVSLREDIRHNSCDIFRTNRIYGFLCRSKWRLLSSLYTSKSVKLHKLGFYKYSTGP